jgi:hypothetical protein
MSAPSERDVKRLCCLSMNQCAFPGCFNPLVSLTNELVGEICHIKARQPRGPRYDAALTEEEKNSFANLILLCRNHHKVVDDDPDKYTVAWLHNARTQHLAMGSLEISAEDGRVARLLLQDYLRKQPTTANVTQIVVGDGNTVAGRDVIRTEKVVRKNVVQPGAEHISEQQAFQVKAFVDKLAQRDVEAGRGDTHKAWYGYLYNVFKITSYKLIRADQFEDVLSWFRQQKGMTRSRLRRPANQTWRNEIYGGIYARWQELGHAKEAIYPFALEYLGLKKAITSLKQLGERDLKKLHGKIVRM